VPKNSFADFSRRSIAIVAEVIARFELMLDRHEHLLTENEQRIADWLRSGLTTSRLHIRGQLQSIQTDEHPTETTYRLAFSRVSNFLDPLQAYHQRLRHLPLPNLLRESVVFVQRAWASWASPLGQTPSLCLANEFEPSEHHLEEQQGTAQPGALFDGDKTVIALAKIDYANPLSWPLLLHELAHAAIRGKTFENTENLTGYQLDWLLEVGCDRVAMRLCGPSYIAAYSAQAIFKLAYFVGSPGHPAPAHRADILIRHAPDWIKSTRLFKSIEPLLEARLYAESELQGELPDTIALICPACRNHVSDYSRKEHSNFSAIATDFFAELDAKIVLTDRSATPDSTLLSLEQRLTAGVLIGSSRADRDRLTAAFDAAKQKRDNEQELSADEIRTLKDAVCDVPNSIFDIIHAGWNHYLLISNEHIQRLQEVSVADDQTWTDAWHSYREAVASYDQLLLASIETSDVHSLIGGLRTYGDA
jgi:hypothetical protein